MKPKKTDRVPHDDIKATAHEAARLQAIGYTQTDLRDVTEQSANIHPTVSHEPVMPQEVFYHEQEISGSDLPDDPENK